MSEIKLLPCPFCGGEAELDNSVANAVSVECTVCHASSPIFLRMSDREQKAIESWNTRKPMERILTRLEEEERTLQDKYERNLKKEYDDPFVSGRLCELECAIEIVKEEGGIE